MGKGSVTETQGLHGINAQYMLPGEYNIGALFPFHTVSVGFAHRSKPEEVTCDSFYPVGYGNFLAMTFAIDEINNSTSLLPGVQLGYEIYDDCFETLASLLPSLLLLSKDKSNGIDVLCNYTEYRNRVIALIGPWTSEQAIVTAKLFSLFLVPHLVQEEIPQDSATWRTAGDQALAQPQADDTVGSTMQDFFGMPKQTQKQPRRFDGSTGLISYGSSSEKLSNKKFFPSFLRTVQNDQNQAMAIVSIIRKFNWNWIVGIGSDDEYGRQGIELVQKYALFHNICIGYIELIPVHFYLSSTKQKISDIVDRITQMNVSVIILFSSERPAHEFLKQIVKANFTGKIWIGSEAWVKSAIIYAPDVGRIGHCDWDAKEQDIITKHGGNQTFPFWPHPTESSSQLLNAIQHLMPKNLSMVLDQPATFSVYIAVYSIAHALHTLLKCHYGRCQNTAGWQNWQLLEELKQVNFTISNTTIYYDAAGNLQRGYNIITWIQHAGQLKLTMIGSYKDQLTVDASQIQWKTVNNKVPPSHCSKSCGLGQKKIAISLYSCCFECEGCPGGTFQNVTDSFSCNECQPDEWSPPNSSSYFKKTLQYLSWISPVGITLLLFMVLELMLILAIMVIFLRYIHSGWYITLCISLMGQGTICYFWLNTDGDFLMKTTGNSKDALVLYCKSDSEVMFWLMLGYSGLQALACFKCTFLIQTPPQTYNLAWEISVSMLFYIIIWLCFIPSYTAVSKKHASSIQIAATLLSCFAILSAYFVPKCFVIYFKPQYNTPDYFLIYDLQTQTRKECQ
ncbi:taste receptor type 1 member 3-like [Stegostoma tigrinum]|uniref:taste receptor type 1 member 3-like n=1 Tax=Stegostoma tigrinum TaxID=3053191 RepID=UPI002870471F|nr:taste receptor type 1 member 3-like [Stegostoma tigrinum]